MEIDNGERFFSLKAEHATFRVPMEPLEEHFQSFVEYIVSVMSVVSRDNHLENEPLVLPGVKARELGAYLNYLLPEYPHTAFALSRPLTEYDLEAILKLSGMYGTPCGRKYVIGNLLRLSPAVYSYVFILELSVKYRVPRLFKYSISALISNPVPGFSMSDLERIPAHLLSTLLGTRKAVEAARLDLLRDYHTRLASVIRIRNAHEHFHACSKFMWTLWEDIARRTLFGSVWVKAKSILEEIYRRIVEGGSCVGCLSIYRLEYCKIFTTEVNLIEREMRSTIAAEGLADDE